MLQCSDAASPEEALLSPACQGDPGAADYLERFDERAATLIMLGRLGDLYSFASTAYRSENKPLRWAIAFWLSQLGACRVAARDAADDIRRLWAANWSDPAPFRDLDSPAGTPASRSHAQAAIQTQGEAGRAHPGVRAFIRCHPDPAVRGWLGASNASANNDAVACVPCQ